MPAGGIASAAPPPVAWAPAPSPATTVESGQVTGLARVAGIILIVLGALTTLGGVILLASGAFLGAASSQTDVPFFAGAVGGLVFFFGVIVAGLGVIQILAGIGARRGSGAARITGIVVGVLFAYFGLVGLVGAGDGNSGDSSPLVALAILLLYGFVALVLAFRWKSRSA
jgi:hypothetical protein